MTMMMVVVVRGMGLTGSLADRFGGTRIKGCPRDKPLSADAGQRPARGGLLAAAIPDRMGVGQGAWACVCVCVCCLPLARQQQEKQ
jgi:hypothetical protein